VVEGGSAEPFFLLNVVRVVKCIDDRRTEEVQYYEPGCEEVFRDRIGEYRAVRGMKIDPARVGNEKVIRTWGWLGTIVVAEEIKEALEQIQTVGVQFQGV